MDAAVIIALVSFLVSAVTALITYRFNRITIRNTAQLEHNKMLLDIDKLLIANPELWGVYDDHPMGANRNEEDPHTTARKEAFIYYYINLFDVVYEFYNRQIIQNRNDRKQWKAWQQFMEHFLSGSSQARETVMKSYHLYDQDQSQFYERMLNGIKSKGVESDAGVQSPA